MTLTRVNTEHFSDVELAAKAIAEDVRSLQSDLALSRQLVLQNWAGEGRAGFMDLSIAVEWQIKDIADEFWKMYEKVIEIETAFMEGDQGLATEYETAMRESAGACSKS